LSAKTGAGIDLLKQHLKECAGYASAEAGQFSARRRHLDALSLAATALEEGRRQLEVSGAGELLAEDLKLCQQHLGEITGEFSSDDLLGEIFSSFCIGK
jgi:tRNA modification GTPase